MDRCLCEAAGAILLTTDNDFTHLIPDHLDVRSSTRRSRDRTTASRSRDGYAQETTSTDVDALLDEMVVDAYGDDEQLTALAAGIGEALDFPLDVHVVGEPLSLVALDHEGNARRGLVGRCRREDGTEYQVSLADVELPPVAAGYLHVAAAASGSAWSRRRPRPLPSQET